MTFIREIKEQLRLIGQNPYMYPLRPEIDEEVRLATVGRYVILFAIEKERNVVRVERVVYGGRDLMELYGR